jgi:carbon-monoxide dehydrogenase small subunit
MPETVTYELSVNDERRVVEGGWLGESLLFVLRERLGLPGAKDACEQGECGSCSVRLDNRLVCACLVLAADAEGRSVTTVEGLAGGDDGLTDVQRAFLDEGAVQCGFCTPGLVMSVHYLLDRNPAPDDLELREAISGNLCRCTGYGRILAAARTVVARRGETSLRESTPGPA